MKFRFLEIKYSVIVVPFVVLFLCTVSPFFCKGIADQVSPEESFYTVALGAYKNGFFDIAIDQFRQFLELYPKSKKVPFAWFRLGEAYRIQNKASFAKEAYQNVLDLYPGHEISHRALFHLSGLNFSLQDYDSALSGYQRLLKSPISDDLAQEAQFWLAESLYQLGRYPEALAAYRTFLNKWPDHKLGQQALYSEGWCLMELAQYDKAAEVFRMLLRQDPPMNLLSQIHLKLGDAMFELKDFNGSVSHYSSYLKLVPDGISKVLLRQGVALSMLGRDQDAIQIFNDFLQKAQKGDALIPEVLIRSGQILYKQNNFTKAIDTLKVFTKEYPGHPMIPEAHYQMARNYLKIGKDDLAEQSLKEIVENFPNHENVPQAALYLGNIYYQTNRIKEATDYYSKAASAKDSSIAAEAVYRLAESFLLMGEREKAVRTFQSIQASYPDQPMWVQMGIFRTANVYEKEGDFNGAIGIYKNVVNIKGGTEDLIKAAQKRLEAILKDLQETDKKETTGKKEGQNETNKH